MIFKLLYLFLTSSLKITYIIKCNKLRIVSEEKVLLNIENFKTNKIKMSYECITNSNSDEKTINENSKNSNEVINVCSTDSNSDGDYRNDSQRAIE